MIPVIGKNNNVATDVTVQVLVASGMPEFSGVILWCQNGVAAVSHDNIFHEPERFLLFGDKF